MTIASGNVSAINAGDAGTGTMAGETKVAGMTIASGNVSAINAVDAGTGTVAGGTKVAGMTSNGLAAFS